MQAVALISAIVLRPVTPWRLSYRRLSAAVPAVLATPRHRRPHAPSWRPSAAHRPMAPLPPPEPSRHLETTASLDARKLRFELNRMVLPIGLEASFGVIRHPGASLAVPVLDDGRVVILRQYRFAVATRLLEFPAGTLDPGEEPLATMERELQEEAGYRADRWDPLGAMLPCPGYSDEVIHLFLARELTPLEAPPAGDDDEDMEVLLLDRKSTRLNSSHSSVSRMPSSA